MTEKINEMKKFYFLFSEGSKVNQILCAIMISLPVFGYGASIGWMSPMTLLLQSDHSPRGAPMTDNEISWMASAAYLTSIPANFLMSYMGDKLGRKTTLFFISAVACVAWIIKLSSYETWAFVLARALLGIVMAGAYVTCPLYIKEISQNSIRGLLGTFVMLSHTSGNLFLYVIGDMLSYTKILWVCLAVPAIHLVLFTLMPESPSYLVKNGRDESLLFLTALVSGISMTILASWCLARLCGVFIAEAAKVIAWLRCSSDEDVVVRAELSQLQKEQKLDDESSGCVVKAILSDKILCRAFRIATVVSLAREACGATPVTNFAGDIFENASKGSSRLMFTANQQAMMLGGVQVAGAALASSIVEKTGRKTLLFASTLISGISMTMLSSWFLARDYGFLATDWLPVATLCLCIFCDASGFLPVSIVMTGEMFSFKYRGTVLATTMSLASFADFLQMLFFKKLVSLVGIHFVFYFFALVCLAASIYVILVVPETKMRSLEEIHEDLKTKKEKAAELEAATKDLEVKL